MNYTTKKIQLAKGISDFDEPIIMAHRAAGMMAPDSTKDAYKYCTDLGIGFLDADIRLGADGSILVHHDATIDRMTTTSGNVSDQTVISWKNLEVDDLGLNGYDANKLMTLSDLLNSYGNKFVLVLELKTIGMSSKVIKLFETFGLRKDMVIIQAFSSPELLDFISSGYTTMYLTADDPNAYGIAVCAANSIPWIGVLSDATYISDCVSAGLKVAAWTVLTQEDYDISVTAGANMIITDDPQYVSGLNRVNFDLWKSGYLVYGMAQSNSKTSVPPTSKVINSIKNGGCEYDNVADTPLFIRHGCFAPLPQNIEITYDFTYFSSANSLRWFGILLLDNDNNNYYDSAGNGGNGYNIICRINGSIDIYQITNGAPAQVLTFSAGTAFSENDVIQIKITKSGTSLTVERIGGSSDSLTIPTTQLKQLYTGFSGIHGRFSNMEITDL